MTAISCEKDPPYKDIVNGSSVDGSSVNGFSDNDYTVIDDTIYFIVSTTQGIYKVSEYDDTSFLFPGKNVEIYEKNIYTTKYNSYVEVYTIDGILQSTIDIPSEVKYFIDFVVIPNMGFAFLDNRYDKVYITDLEGNFLRSISIPNVQEGGDNHLQNVDGIIIENNIVISENGNNEIFCISLEDYSAEIYKNLSHLRGWLGAFDYYKGINYICQATRIYSFIEDGSPNLISELPEGNITGIVIYDGHAFVTINFKNKIMKVNLDYGTYEDFASGLSYPKDIELYQSL
jgi:hypothetical protein